MNRLIKILILVYSFFAIADIDNTRVLTLSAIFLLFLMLVNSNFIIKEKYFAYGPFKYLLFYIIFVTIEIFISGNSPFAYIFSRITLFFPIYLIVSLCRANEGIAFASLFIILAICGMTDLIMAALEIYIMRFVAVAVAGVLLIIIISFITGCNSENIHILISSSGLVICCCVIASFFLSSMSIISMKYYLVFLIGIILFFLIYVIVSLCRAEVVIAFASLFIILVICGLTDLIMAALEIYYMRFISVAVIAFFIFIILLAGTECNPKKKHTVISRINDKVSSIFRNPHLITIGKMPG